MKLVKPTYEILHCPTGIEVLEQIERAARTCYKSEGKIKAGSARSLVSRLIENGHHAMIEFGGPITVKFISNRGFTHELVRHRLASFGQESTRYCNYSKGKFGKEITVLEPLFIPAKAKELYIQAMEAAERYYMAMFEHGVPAQVSREVLPIGLKAEIVINANVREWRHIFKLRCSRKAHPRMRELMLPLLRELNETIPVVFEDLAIKYLDLI